MKIRYYLPFFLLFFVQFCSDGDIADSLLSRTKILPSIRSDTPDGTVNYTGPSTYTTDTADSVINVGENFGASNYPADGYYCFSLSTLYSAGISASRIVGATVSLCCYDVIGDPAARGLLHIDHVDVPPFPSTVLATDIAITSIPLIAGDWITFPVTAQIRKDIKNARSYTCYRLHLPSCDGGVADYVRFFAYEDGDDNYNPRLIVYYL